MILKTVIDAIMRKWKRLYNLNKKKLEWRKRNQHNYTKYMNIGNIDSVSIGNYSYGDLSMQFSKNQTRIKIGHFCSIGKNVFFLPDSNHPLDMISTYPFKTMFGEDNHNLDAISKGDIVIDDDVWIGYNATILSGVHISQGAVVAAGSVVTKDIPPYAIVGGVPAKVIKYRFSDELINELLKIDYGKLTKQMIMEHMEELYSPLKDVKQLSWMPK